MSKAERPFPPARDFDLSQSKRVGKDFDINKEIPLPFRDLVNFLKSESFESPFFRVTTIIKTPPI